MVEAEVNGELITFTYDTNGLRTSKCLDNVTTYNYYYVGDLLVCRTWDDGVRQLNFLYDESGNVYGFVYNDGLTKNPYYYVKNLQGDVIAILNSGNIPVAEYVYDAWGNILSVTDGNGNAVSLSADHIGNINPIRYRSYYYDTETMFYYLQSRYYDPYIGRFINADGYMSTGQGFMSYNMYAYCGNNPVDKIDSCGQAPLKVARYLLTHWLMGTGKDLILSEDSFTSRKFKRSPTMKKKIEEEIQKYKNGEEYGEGTVSFKSKETDLWLAARNAEYSMSIETETKTFNYIFFETTKTRYVVNVTVSDTYNFNIGNEKGDGLGSFLNNIGYDLHENDIGVDYYWEARYVYKTKWK